MAIPLASVTVQDHDPDGGYFGGMCLHPICYGEGKKANFHAVLSSNWSRFRHEPGTNRATIMQSREFDRTVHIDFHGDKAHTCQPKKLIPLDHSR